MKRTIIITALFFIFIPVVYAQDDYKSHPGYVDFGSFGKFQDTEKSTEVFVKGPLLKFVSQAASLKDPDLADLLNKLLIIKVNVFSLDKVSSSEALNILKNISKKIDPDKWELMVRKREPDEYVEVYTQFGKAGNLSGLVVMVVKDNDEAVFVNIAGDIDPSKLGKLSKKFNIPKLDALEIEAKSNN